MEEQQKQERIIQMKAWEEQMTMDIEAMKAIVVPGDYITSVSHNAEGTTDTVKFKETKTCRHPSHGESRCRNSADRSSAGNRQRHGAVLDSEWHGIE